jgi:hypothetical protein
VAHLARLGWLLAFALVAFIAFRASVGKISLALVDTNPRTNSQEWATRPVRFAGGESCDPCHQDLTESWTSSAHKSVECETCHSVAREHALTGAAMPPLTGDASLCGLCHEQVFSRPEGFPQMDPEEHAGGQACTECHSAHSPRRSASHQLPASWEGLPQCLTCHQPSDCALCHSSLMGGRAPTGSQPAAASGGPPHVPHAAEERYQCLSCHGPQGLKPVPASHKGRTNEVCLTCHETT